MVSFRPLLLGTSVLLAALLGPASAYVHYFPDNTYVRRHGQPTWHSIRVVSDVNGYSITTLPYNDKMGADSSIQCGADVNDSARMGVKDQPLFTGPCQTSTGKHLQRIHLQCIDPHQPSAKRSGSAVITFHHNRADSGRVQVEAKGELYYGFTYEPARSPLHSSGTSTSKPKKHVGVVINCYANVRK